MVLRFIFGWGWKVRRLRKRWDKLREKSLKKKKPLRDLLLEKLDKTENNLRTLEEQVLNRAAKARISKELEIDLAEIKAMLKTRPEELKTYQNVGEKEI